jgi:outer membrane protein assembly factor BamB
MWFTQIQVDATRDHVVQVTQHVSAKQSTTIYEVVYRGGRYSYRETDLDARGAVIGKARAQKLAEIKLNELQAQQVAAQLVTQTIPQVSVYAATSAGRVHAIDGETGRTRWVREIGNPRHPTLGAGANDDFVATVNGSRIYLLRASDGNIAWDRRASGAPGAGPALSDTMVYVPMINGVLEAYPLDQPLAFSTNYRSHGRALIQPVYTGTHILWPTDRGHLYVTHGTANQISFRLEAKDSIVAPASFLPPNRIVVSSIDGFVYCLRENTGSLEWRFSAGEPIDTTPVPFGDAVYFTTTDATLFCVDANLGVERWSMPHLSKVIGASQTRLYCLSDTHRLSILDRATGSLLGSLPTESSDLAYVNKQTDRLLLGTSTGLIQCLREQSQHYPLLHIPLAKPEQEAPKRKKAPAAKKPAAGQEDTGDPFSAPGAAPTADPFSAPAGGAPTSDPFGAPGAAPAGDPFGTGAPATPAAPASPPAENPFGE